MFHCCSVIICMHLAGPQHAIQQAAIPAALLKEGMAD